MVLEHFFGFLQGKRHGAKTAMRELEISLRAKDPVTPLEDTEIYSITMEATLAFLLNFLGSGSLVWFATRKAPKFLGFRPLTGPQSFSYSFGCASLLGNMMYYESYVASATHVLEGGEECMKMELAKIILNNHSTDELLVGAVQRHFIAENLLSDQHQDQRLFRWRQRNSYVDYTFKERMKEYEANSSEDDEAESSRLFEEDSLACILGTPGSNTEMSKSAEHTGGTVLTRRELHVHREVIGPRRGHADKAPAF
ncbi:uncharacterized protein LOC124685938 isoform X2 [Lolium rigidum]|uniref:uncharacterized protein LOC124685938 isoform X2 n=1 Tax=Lolium rigidum TaxID=89674 RepID=UPI001F5C7EDA|nr:uncharacterized protein LOC124685938 isoform X2 [Lolium rigidum]